MMIKLCGSVLIVAATTLLGIRRADDYREEYRQMEYLKRLLYILESEIRYAREPLGEIFAHMAGHAREPYRSWLSSMQQEIEQREQDSFAGIWRASIRGHLKRCGLPGRELDRLAELGEQLGTADLKLELTILAGFQEHLSVRMRELRGEMQMRVKLCHWLGVMSGMFLAILLL